MKRRVRKIANFFAFNLLFFALYLNFIHKDKMPAAGAQNAQQSTAAFSGTALVDNPEQYLETKTDVTVVSPKTNESNTAALKLSIN
ncbi:MAG: hypothetical protein WBC06_02245 [Chitinophagaceae bacterium]